MGESGRFRSRFGGLWIDRVDADDELVERVGSGALAPEMAAQIVAFVRDGWIILPGAVPLDLTRQIRAELDDLWATPPPGALVETYLAASWIALEDVKRGSGELQYFTGSHHDPEFLFGGRHKWMVGAPDDHGRFLQSLQDDALRNGRERTLFRPKEGDVLIWHADLAHGGARIRRRWRTRQSLVTHFTPEPCNPPYASAGDHVPVEADGCLFLSEHGQIDLATSVAPLS